MLSEILDFSNMYMQKVVIVISANELSAALLSEQIFSKYVWWNFSKMLETLILLLKWQKKGKWRNAKWYPNLGSFLT